MSEVDQLLKRVQNLRPRDFAEFRAWFVEFDPRVWDREIEADVKAGKLTAWLPRLLQTTEPGRRGSFESFCIAQVLGVVPGTPTEARELADRSFTLLKSDPRHSSLRLKRLGKLCVCDTPERAA